MSAITVTDSSFEQDVLKSSLPVVIDFWASWCAPCRAMEPIIDELATHFAGKITFAKVNVEDCPSIASQYGILNVPILLVFKNGEPVAKRTGPGSRSDLQRWAESHA